LKKAKKGIGRRRRKEKWKERKKEKVGFHAHGIHSLKNRSA